MKMLIDNDIIVVHQRQGNDKNGNPIYLINFFKNKHNINFLIDRKKDKYDNIRIQSYSIEEDIKTILALKNY